MDAHIPRSIQENATLKFALVFGNDDGSSSARRFELQSTETVRIGRHPKGEIVLTPLTISNLHLEFRLLEGSGVPQLGMRDLSANGTGVQAPGSTFKRLARGVDVPVRDGSIIVLNMRFKNSGGQISNNNEHTCFSVHLGIGPVPANAP